MLKPGASLLAAVLALWTATSTAFGQAPVLDPNLPVYRPVSNLQGELKLTGSNTMSHVAATWASGFRQFYPDVKISIIVDGSREAVSSVADREADMGLLSRSITAEEVSDFQKKLNHPPQVLTPCLERMAVYVHKDNPIKSLTLQQIDAIFSQDCKRGSKDPIRTWGQLGFPGAWAEQPVVAQGRKDDTGSQVFLQDAILLGGKFRSDLQNSSDNLGMLNAIVSDPRSIGFAGLCYDNPNVRTVPVGIGSEGPFISIDSPEADAGHYPLARPLQLVVNHDPSKPLPALQAEFVKYVFSRLGQEDVIKSGFQAIPARPANIALDAVGLGVAR